MSIPVGTPPTPEQWVSTRLAKGFAICPRCFAVHAEAGRQHLISPWRITPCCTECGEPLLMPQRTEKAA